MIQPEDVEMLDTVYQYPAINTKHPALLFGKYRPTMQRARRLLNAGLLLRCHAQHVAFWKQGVNEPAVHFISTLGAHVLEEHKGYIFPKSDYDRIANERVNYSHERNVADFHVRMTIGAKTKATPYVPRKLFIRGAMPEKLNEVPFKTNTKNHNWELARIKVGNVHLQPDDMFVLVTDKVRMFFLEIDQNTVPNMPRDKRKTIQEMFEKYIQVFKQGLYKQYKVDNFMVLFITKSDAHISYLVKLVKDAPIFFTSRRLTKSKQQVMF